MNTEMLNDDFEKLAASPDEISSKTSEALTSLEEKLSALEDQKKEERFCWVILFFILFDALVFANSQTWGAPIAILILEIIFLVVFARKCGVEDVVRLLDKLFHSIGNRS